MIPRLVHRVWLGGPEPDWQRPFRATWQAPGTTIWDWNEESVRALFPLFNQETYDDAEAIAGPLVGQLRADLLRYEILEKFGGVYVDTDVECLRPIWPLIETVGIFAAWEKPGVWINNAVMGAEAHHPFLLHLIESLPESVRQFRRFRPNRYSGPQYMTPLYRAYRYEFERDGGGVIFDKELFYPYMWDELGPGGAADGRDFEGAYTVHHWNHMRQEKGKPYDEAQAAGREADRG